MMMTRVHILAIAAGILIPISGPSFAAHQPGYPSSIDFRGAVKENRGVVTQPYVSSRVPAFDYRRGTSDRPFGPEYNFPYPDRPYGDPGHW